jgi:hypothetical protein
MPPARPFWSKASTWSFMRAISGETTTASRQMGGRSLVADRLAAAGGQDDQESRPSSTARTASS